MAGERTTTTATWRRLGFGLAAATLVAAPFLATGYQTFQFSQVVIYAIALVGLNLLTGVNGQISLGHGAFFAVGGYVEAILTTRYGAPYGLALVVAAAFAFALGFLFGLPALRLEPLYLSLATFALAVATPQMLKMPALAALTGGAEGLSLVKPRPPAFLPLTRDQWLYVLCLAFAIPTFWLARNLMRGRIGRALIAIRDQPIAAEAMAVDASLYKTSVFGLSAGAAGLAGGLASLAVGFVAPDSFGLFLSLSFLVGVVVGGLGSLPGVIVGAAFIEYVPNIADRLSGHFGEGAKALPSAIYGALLIGLMYVAPAGVAGLARRLAAALQRAGPKMGG